MHRTCLRLCNLPALLAAWRQAARATNQAAATAAAAVAAAAAACGARGAGDATLAAAAIAAAAPAGAAARAGAITIGATGALHEAQAFKHLDHLKVGLGGRRVSV